mgnify:CR=1 FL=1
MGEVGVDRASDYRWLGIVATALGLLVLLAGLALSKADVAITGGIIAAVHGILSLIIYAGARQKRPKSLDRA